jgi:hypothetical protein
MPDDRPQSPADPEEFLFSLSHALQYDVKRHLKRADGFVARIVAGHLAECLCRSGYVTMKRPPLSPHSRAAGMQAGHWGDRQMGAPAQMVSEIRFFGRSW